MSKLYEMYKRKKEEDSTKHYLFPSGMFYLFLDEDAREMSEKLNLKLTPLNQEIQKCGFPMQSLEKYEILMKEMDYEVVAEQPKYKELYFFDKKLVQLLKKIKKMDLDEISYKESYLVLEKLKGMME